MDDHEMHSCRRAGPSSLGAAAGCSECSGITLSLSHADWRGPRAAAGVCTARHQAPRAPRHYVQQGRICTHLGEKSYLPCSWIGHASTFGRAMSSHAVVALTLGAAGSERVTLYSSDMPRTGRQKRHAEPIRSERRNCIRRRVEVA